ncbi:MAG: amine dehydrogenase large subunit [Candidatus Azotimanducaceae bacterium]
MRGAESDAVHKRPHCGSWRIWLGSLALCFVSSVSLATASSEPLGDASIEPLKPETIYVQRLGQPSPHWLILNDPNFLGNMDSKIYLIDADRNHMLGMLAAGGWRNAVEYSSDFSTIYSPETYYSRTTRGQRTDVLSFYDVASLSPVDEIEIPAKRGSGAAHRSYSGRSDDGRFVYVFNMTPAMTVTVVDVVARQVAAEIGTDGCAMIYPSGNFSFLSLCGNGRIRQTILNQQGVLEETRFTDVFFDPQQDPLTEKATRLNGDWYFVSFHGAVHRVAASDAEVNPSGRWALLDQSELAAGWRPGGAHFLASHRSGVLYVGMNQAGPDSHKQPAQQVWMMNVDDMSKRQVIEPPGPVTQLAVSQDTQPLLAAASEGPEIYLFDALTGIQKQSLAAPILGAGILQFVDVR